MSLVREIPVSAAARIAENEQGLKWHITRFIHYSYEQIEGEKILKPVRRALKHLKNTPRQ